MSTPLIFETRAQGKLLLTGEYFVLGGASALAIPVRFGQSLRVEKGTVAGQLDWWSQNPDGTHWFEGRYELPSLRIRIGSDVSTSLTLFKILLACKAQNPEYFTEHQSFKVITQNDFPREWGLGTSSTLIAALARWMDLDPYKLLFDTIGGSGYDIACAYAEGPILYRLDGQTPVVSPISFSPDFSDQLYFVYLGKKQNSREAIARYRQKAAHLSEIIEKISTLTERFLEARTLPEFEEIIREHEYLVSDILELPRAKDLYFNDFWGEVKSLGAWGGDFVLVTSARAEMETRAYFALKAYDVFLPWQEMVG